MSSYYSLFFSPVSFLLLYFVAFHVESTSMSLAFHGVLQAVVLFSHRGITRGVEVLGLTEKKC